MNANSSDRSSQRCDASSASPAAGEQAGAVAKLRHVYTNLVNGGVRDTTSAKRIAAGLLSPAIEVLERLAAPGAAIAAREQEKAQAAINAIAALAPQLEDSVHGPRRRCQHCDHAWQTNEKEHHALNCAYVIATSVPHTPPASRDEAPATPQAGLSNTQIADCVTAVRPYSVALATVPAEELIAFVRNIEAALTQPTTVQQAEVTDEQIRDGFRDYDKELVARHRTPWQIWRDSSAWTQSALKGLQPGERKEQS